MSGKERVFAAERAVGRDVLDRERRGASVEVVGGVAIIVDDVVVCAVDGVGAMIVG